jgi:pilus assembly protein Flp/PilA
LDVGQQPELGNIMGTLILRFLSNEDAATAIEYGLIAAGISVAIIGAVNTVGVQLNTVLYQKITTALAQ